MNKIIVWCILIALMSMTVTAVDLKDTTIDFFDYREVVPGEGGVIYKIMLTNTGEKARTYELTPDTDAVRAVGTYRIDPSTEVRLSPEESATLYFYLQLDKDINSRLSIPVEIKSGSESTTIELAARPIGEPVQQTDSFLKTALNIALYFLLAIIIIAFLIRLFRKKKKDEDSPEVETYY